MFLFDESRVRTRCNAMRFAADGSLRHQKLNLVHVRMPVLVVQRARRFGCHAREKGGLREVEARLHRGDAELLRDQVVNLVLHASEMDQHGGEAAGFVWKSDECRQLLVSNSHFCALKECSVSFLRNHRCRCTLPVEVEVFLCEDFFSRLIHQPAARRTRQQCCMESSKNRTGSDLFFF